jgi:NAD-dependent DNA ligase
MILPTKLEEPASSRPLPIGACDGFWSQEFQKQRFTTKTTSSIKTFRIGDTVWIHKAGEIIPEVIEVNLMFRKEQKPFQMIKYVQNVIFQSLEKQVKPIIIVATRNCPAKSVNQIIHFASRTALDIDTLGEKVVKVLFDEGYITDVTDIYSLKNHSEQLKAFKVLVIRKFHLC